MRRKGAAYDRSSGQHNALRAAGRARTGPPAGGGRVDDGGAHRRGARHRAPFAVPARVRGRRSWRAVYRPASTRGSGRGVKPAPAPGGVDLTGRAERRLDACGPGRQASEPRRPASGPAASTPGNGGGAHEVTSRDHPAPAPAGLPLRQGRAALLPRRATRPRGLSSCPRSPSRPPRADAGRRRPGGGRT
jgi:hypothetical protein